MASIQEDLRTRAFALMTGSHGLTGFSIEANRFHEAVKPLGLISESDLNQAERAFSIRLNNRRPLRWNNPSCNDGLFLTDLTIEVTYLVGYGESEYEGFGQQSGGSIYQKVEDRAADDAHKILHTLGYQPNWAGLSISVIDPFYSDPAPAQPFTISFLEQLAISTILLTILTRTSQYGSFGPTV